MMRTLLFTVLAAATLTACAAVQRPSIDARAAAQVELATTEPPPGCGYIGPIKGSTLVGDLADANGDAVRTAVMIGGNYVVVDVMERPVLGAVGGYVVRGRLFNCPRPQAPQTAQAPRPPVQVASVGPQSVAQASDAAVAPKAICEPDCSPGFTCLHAVCVSACNPGCAAGEQCGADRSCHARQ
ncbi:MAG: hypothetical protein ABJE95_02525 [Byssovorax sp.]